MSDTIKGRVTVMEASGIVLSRFLPFWKPQSDSEGHIIAQGLGGSGGEDALFELGGAGEDD